MHLPAYSPAIGEHIIHDERPDKHLLLMMGVPDERAEEVGHCKSCLLNDATREMMEILHDPNVPIVAMMSGHVHFEFKPHDFIAEEEIIPGRWQYGLRLSAPQLTPEGVVFLLHLVPEE